MGLQNVTCDKVGTEPEDNYTFFNRNGNADCHLGTGFSIHKEYMLEVKRVEFVSDRMSYLI